MRIVSALKCVDEVALITNEETVDKVLAWKKFKFNVLFSGDDWKGSERFIATQRAFKEKGLDIETVFFPYTAGVSTTQIKGKINK